MKKFSKILVNSIIFIIEMIIASAVGLVLCALLDSFEVIKCNVKDNEFLIHLIWFAACSGLVYYLLSYIINKYVRYIEMNCLHQANRTLKNCDKDGTIYTGREISEEYKEILLNGINCESIKQK